MNYQFLLKQKKWKLFVLIGLVAAFCVGIVIFQRNHATNRTASGKVQTTVEVVQVERSDLVKRISLTGQTVPEAQVDIAAKYQGRVLAVNAGLGQAVTPGQVLVVQDTGDADLSISQNQAAYQQASAEAVTSEASFNANYDRAKADYQKALASFQRSKNLFNVGGISREEFDASQQQLADAKASMDSLANQINSGVAASIQASRAAALKAQHSVSAAEKQRDDLTLRAPRSGIIGYRQVEVGDIVQAGQKILSIFDNSNLYVDCQIAEQDLGALSLGQGVEVQVESLGKTVPGQVIYISPASDAQTLTFSLRIALVNPDPAIRSGMFAKAVINAPLRQNVLVVPKDAALEKNGTYYVFVVNDQNVVDQRAVQIGAHGDDQLEILSGINEGEQIAVNNLARLRSGLVIVPSTATPDNRGGNQ